MDQCCIALGNAIQENDNPIFYKSFLREYNLKRLPVFAGGVSLAFLDSRLHQL